MEPIRFEEYLREWIKGIRFEIDFWDKLMKSRGKIGGDRDIFEFRISPHTPFLLEKELEREYTKFLDVGSGPFSNCGAVTIQKKISIKAIDPLAEIYKKLKHKYDVESPIIPETGMVELLSDQFEENMFDVVHMSNSLDHCFDPIEGIKQMLYVCNQGGKIILRHNENEAEHAHYSGFHQWNVCLDRGEFIIWRPGEKINVGNEISEWAVVERAEIAREEILHTTWTHNRFVIRKKKDILLEKNKYRGKIANVFLEEICHMKEAEA